jgi:hypothetical protein
MQTTAIDAIDHLPERGEPRRAMCALCRHPHACYVVERPLVRGDHAAADTAWALVHVCLGCLMRASDADARAACDDCTDPA